MKSRSLYASSTMADSRPRARSSASNLSRIHGSSSGYSIWSPAPSTGSSTIFTNYELVSADDFTITDDFGDAAYKTGSNAHLNRIPMRYEEMMESFGYNPTSTNQIDNALVLSNEEEV